MSRSRFCAFVLAIVLAGMTAATNQVKEVDAAQPTIWINADGSITPINPLITTADNVTYILTGNITGTTGYETINVQRDNIVLDGAGHTVQNTAGYSGIWLGGRSNVTVKNVRFSDPIGSGIRLNDNEWITIDNCTFINNNPAVGHGYGTGPKDFTFSNNKVIGPVVVWPVPRRDGVQFSSVYDGLISGNTIQHCGYGIVIYGYENVTIKDNLIDDCSWGIWPVSDDLNISILDNTFTNNGVGINVGMGQHPTLRIYHNRFFNNREHARGEGATLFWDNGYPSGGNYWGGFVSPDLHSGEYQNITGGDGIGDNPFIIPLPYNVKDRYPLMLLGVSNVSQAPPASNVLPNEAVEVNATVRHVYPLTQVTLNCTYTNSSATWTRLVNMTSLDEDTWHGGIPPAPAGTNVTYTILAYDDIGDSVSSEDQGYVLEYSVVPEFPSLLILPFFLTATLMTIVLLKRKHHVNGMSYYS